VTFEEFQGLGREEQLRAQLDELALVGSSQARVIDPFSEMIGIRDKVTARQTVAHQISKETHVGESTVLKVIESYERTAVKAAG